MCHHNQISLLLELTPGILVPIPSLKPLSICTLQWRKRIFEAFSVDGGWAHC